MTHLCSRIWDLSVDVFWCGNRFSLRVFLYKSISIFVSNWAAHSSWPICAHVSPQSLDWSTPWHTHHRCAHSLIISIHLIHPLKPVVLAPASTSEEQGKPLFSPLKTWLVMNKFTAHYSGLDLLQNSAGTNNLVCQHLSLDSSINVTGPNLNSKLHLTAGPSAD